MKLDALARRSRFAPPNAKVRRLALTEPDLLIFEAINRHGPLPIHYLYEFSKHLRKDYTHLQNRLTEFYNGSSQSPYLVRPPQQFASFEARYQPLIYDLAPRAKQALAERGTLVRHAVRRSDPFLHRLMGACVGSSIELSAPSKGLRYISREEILAHPTCPEATKAAANPLAIPLRGLGAKTALIPDDLFGLEYPGVGFRFFAVEIDRNTESIERKRFEQNAFAGKIAGYVDILRNQTYRTWWGVPNLYVLTVTTNRTHAHNIVDYIRRRAEPNYGERFGFAFDASFGADWRVPREVLSKLLEEPWMTMSLSKDISRP
jgi:hypothetical protein